MIDLATEGAGGQTDNHVVSVANDGDGALNWQASTAQGWLKLSSSSGAAPDNVTVTFDAAGLTPGDHSGMITFTDVRSG